MAQKIMELERSSNRKSKLYFSNESTGHWGSKYEGERVVWLFDADKCLGTLKETFLPVGFPNTTKNSYIEYQMWDSLQALSSYLRGVLTTRALLTGAGVGNANANALSVTLSWCIKDGFGIIGSLIFAYWASPTFEIYPKEWRFIADCLCNIGLFAQMLVHSLPHLYLPLIIISSISFACLGIAAGAAKARISAHFAKEGHLADVTAKESTQETAVSLIGMVIGWVSASFVDEDMFLAWILFFVCTCAHLYFNYRLVNVLVFNNLNPQRCFLIEKILREQQPDRQIGLEAIFDPSCWPMPTEVAQMESIFLIPIYLSWKGPRIGCPLLDLLSGISFALVNDTPIFSELESKTIYLLNQLENHPFWASLGVIFGFAASDQARVLVCYKYNHNDEHFVKYQNANRHRDILVYLFACWLQREAEDLTPMARILLLLNFHMKNSAPLANQLLMSPSLTESDEREDFWTLHGCTISTEGWLVDSSSMKRDYNAVTIPPLSFSKQGAQKLVRKRRGKAGQK